MTWHGDGRTAAQRGYGHAWRKLRLVILKRDGYRCQPCRRKGLLTAATQVDHIVPKAKLGTDHPSNLQAICDSCHEAKTAADNGAAPSVRIGIDGFPIEASAGRAGSGG